MQTSQIFTKLISKFSMAFNFMIFTACNIFSRQYATELLFEVAANLQELVLL